MKTKTKSRKKRKTKLNLATPRPPVSWNTCYECALSSGAKVPQSGHQGITAMEGICDYCVEKAHMPKTLIPLSDFHWPKLGKKAIWD